MFKLIMFYFSKFAFALICTKKKVIVPTCFITQCIKTENQVVNSKNKIKQAGAELCQAQLSFKYPLARY